MEDDLREACTFVTAVDDFLRCLSLNRFPDANFSEFFIRCIPFRYRNTERGNDDSEKIVEVLMISSASGPGLLFPKV